MSAHRTPKPQDDAPLAGSLSLLTSLSPLFQFSPTGIIKSPKSQKSGNVCHCYSVGFEDGYIAKRLMYGILVSESQLCCRAVLPGCLVARKKQRGSNCFTLLCWSSDIRNNRASSIAVCSRVARDATMCGLSRPHYELRKAHPIQEVKTV